MKDLLGEQELESSTLAAVINAAYPITTRFGRLVRDKKLAWAGYWIINLLLLAALCLLNNYALGWPLWVVIVAVVISHAVFGWALQCLYEAALGGHSSTAWAYVAVLVLPVGGFGLLAWQRFDRSDNLPLALVGLFFDLALPILLARAVAIASWRVATYTFMAELASDAVRSVRITEEGGRSKKYDAVLMRIRALKDKMERSPEPEIENIEHLDDFIERLRRDHPTVGTEVLA